MNNSVTSVPSAADLDAVAAEQAAKAATVSVIPPDGHFVASPAEQAMIEAMRGAKVADEGQPVCNCNCETLPHYHVSNGVRLA